MIEVENNIPDIIKILAAIKKDSERQDAIEKIKLAHKNLLKAEVHSRRMKSQEIIKQLVALDSELEVFEINYNIFKELNSFEEIEAIEEYLKDLKKYRIKLSKEKKRL